MPKIASACRLRVVVAALALAACATPETHAPSPPSFEFVKADEDAIEGTVVAPDGSPVEGAEILVQVEVTSPMPRTVRALTGADGGFRVAVPRATPVVVRVVTRTEPPHGFRHPVERLRVEAGGASDLVVRLRAGVALAGRVVDEAGRGVAGLPLRTATPRAMSSGAYVAAETATDADGAFVFEGLPAGFATIEEVFPPGSTVDCVLLSAADVPTGRSSLVLRRLPLAAVAGRVTVPDGRPVADRVVVLARRGEPIQAESRTDADGRFRTRVAAPGEYVVRLRFAAQSGHIDRDIGAVDATCADEAAFVAPASVK